MIISPLKNSSVCDFSNFLLSDRHIAFMYCFEAIKWDKSLNYKKATLYNQTGQATRVSSRYYGLVYGVRVFCIIPSDRESGCVRWIHIWSSACVNEKSICAFLIEFFLKSHSKGDYLLIFKSFCFEKKCFEVNKNSSIMIVFADNVYFRRSRTLQLIGICYKNYGRF